MIPEPGHPRNVPEALTGPEDKKNSFGAKKEKAGENPHHHFRAGRLLGRCRGNGRAQQTSMDRSGPGSDARERPPETKTKRSRRGQAPPGNESVIRRDPAGRPRRAAVCLPAAPGRRRRRLPSLIGMKNQICIVRYF